MPSKKIRTVLAAIGALVLAACSSTTSGSGSDGGPPSSTDTHDFPSRTTTSTTPTSGRPTSPTSTSRTAARTPTTHPVPTTPLRTATVHGTHGTYVIKVWARVHAATCADHAYGTAVINYLTAHPCTGLDRLLATTVVHGRPVGFAQSSLGFEGVSPRVYEVAGHFRTLVTKDGTGNLKDLFRSGYRLPSGPTHVPSPDAFSAQGQDSGVTIVDAWYLDGSTPDNDPALVAMANDIYLQF
jgi:hypothetical protein